MDRRTFLRHSGITLGVLGAAGSLAACGGEEEAAGAGEGGAVAIPEGPAQLSAAIASWEFLTGPARPVPILVRTNDNVAFTDPTQVYLRSPAGEVLGGPFETRLVEAPGTPFQLHVAEFAVEQAGPIEVVVVAGEQYGATTVNAVSPEQSEIPSPGDTAPVVATPTDDKPRGYEKVCTADPVCGMHETSLDAALEAGTPVMVMFATPEFCQTVVCGPAVDVLKSVREGGDWGDVAWIHVEVYSKISGELKPGKPMRAWNLPSEPWLFAIDRSGAVSARLDGPMLPETVESMATAIKA